MGIAFDEHGISFSGLCSICFLCRGVKERAALVHKTQQISSFLDCSFSENHPKSHNPQLSSRNHPNLGHPASCLEEV